ncbi:MAG: manganese efflux pump [Kutzneria sp.]|nr:manganese efflux pump [Kutzneria sp.]
MSEVLVLLGFVLPLGLDSFAVAGAIGAGGALAVRDRWRITALFVVFEAGMPLVGLALGAPLAHVIGPIANYAAAAAVVAIGLWMLLHDEDHEERAERLVAARGAALIGLGVSISLDELAIGFGVGLAHLPLVPVIVGIAVQAFLAAQLGLRLGVRIAERLREAAERLAGVVLVVLGVVLAVEQLVG